jgi:DNA mismatch repair protein MutL
MSAQSAKTVRLIRPLPERLINKIAAGEVVERPAAVVKELVENALDAGATQIDIIIEKSGLKLMKIVDNGCGIPEDQLQIAFSRHATSKISDFKDLDRIMSYGFRGEALPSIASVSRTRMASRTGADLNASEIIIEGGVTQEKRPIAGAPGTTIEVENLFFNTPARRKFLKSETTEARQISRVVTAMAISSPSVGFSYDLNGRNIFSLPSNQTLQERIGDLLAPGKKMVTLDYTLGTTRVTGAVGLPEMIQSNRLGQYLFLNGRYIQSASLSHALQTAYGELIPRGRFPIGAVLISVEPEEVDVNVHPAKTEVRLADEREVYRAVFHAVGESLQQDKIIPTFRPKTSAHELYAASRPASTATSSDTSRPGVIPGMAERSHTNTNFLRSLYQSAPAQQSTAKPDSVDHSTGEIDDAAPILAACAGLVEGESDNSPSEGLRLVGRFGKLYLMFQSGNDLLIVDQHTAHERINYELTLKQIDKHTVVSQSMLFPVQVELSPERFALFEEVEELLNASGFVVGLFGGRMVNIDGIPSVLSGRSPETILMKVLDDLESSRKMGHDYRKAMAASIACRAAVMSGDRLTDEEAVGLIERLMQCENRYSCPHGRPTFVRLTREEINRQFGRG